MSTKKCSLPGDRIFAMGQETQKATDRTGSRQKTEKPKFEYEDYTIFLHKKKVEVHVAYGNNIIKLQGVLRAKARYNVQLILDEKNKEIVTINKGYIVMIKPI